MIRVAAFFGLAGLIGATAAIAYSGYDQVVAALSQAGWGIVWTALFHIVSMLACVVGWRALLPGHKRPTLPFFLYVLWLRAAVNNLLPVARIGGEIVSVRVLMKNGVRKSAAVACTVVETTLSVIAVFLFNIAGIGLFLMRVSDHNVAWQLMLGVLISLPMIIALLMVQRFGFFGLAAKLFNVMLRDKWQKFTGDAARLDRAVQTMYRRHKRILLCLAMQLTAWVLGTVEIWLALYFLGHSLGLAECFMIEALIQAVAGAAFIIPGALGVQEASFILFGRMLGLTPEIAAALALMRRCRDLMLYIPGLIVWQIQEGKWLLGAKKN